jgi:hypothetical protein
MCTALCTHLTLFLQVKVYHCLTMKHPAADGAQRIRCFPFQGHTFQGRNIMDNVFLLPVDARRSFKLPQDKDQLEFGRTLLLFKIQIPAPLGSWQERSLAFVKYYDKYRVKGVSQYVLYVYWLCTDRLCCRKRGR